MSNEVIKTCKDCFYFDMCDLCCDEPIDLERASKCVAFKDKSKIIELPCKVGDTVYYVTKSAPFEIIKHKISKISIYEKGILFNVGNCGCFVISEIGECVFLTKAEAEQKLKEMQNNA